MSKKTKRKVVKALLETLCGALIGLVLAVILVLGFAFDKNDAAVPEHVGQVQYYGVWWDQDDFEQMQIERQEYVKELEGG